MSTPLRVTLELRMLTETHNDRGAFLLTDGDRQAWVPKSQCQRLADGKFSVERAIAVQNQWLTPPSNLQGALEL